MEYNSEPAEESFEYEELDEEEVIDRFVDDEEIENNSQGEIQ
jgi:hypothetical protein